MRSSLTEIIRQVERSDFYGTLEIKFEAGQIILFRKTETIKCSEPQREVRHCE